MATDWSALFTLELVNIPLGTRHIYGSSWIPDEQNPKSKIQNPKKGKKWGTWLIFPRSNFNQVRKVRLSKQSWEILNSSYSVAVI